MSAIGFRATTSEIAYVILIGNIDEPSVITSGKLKKPKAFELPASLTWYRESALGLFKEYGIDSVGIKTAEPISRSFGASSYQGAIIRAHIEGVLMEAAHHAGKRLVVGPFASISSLIESKHPKKYIKADEFRGIGEWDGLSTNHREAAMAGIAALNLLGGQE